MTAPPASRPPGLYPSCGLKRLGWAVCSGPDGGGAGRHRASPTPVSRGKGFPVSAFGSPSRASLQLCAELTKFLSALRSEEVPPEPPVSHRIRWQELRPSGHIPFYRVFFENFSLSVQIPSFKTRGIFPILFNNLYSLFQCLYSFDHPAGPQTRGS